MADKDLISAILRASSIVDHIFKTQSECSIREICQGTGLTASTVFRQLATLKECGFIYQNPANQKYGLGIRFYAIGNYVKHNLPIVNIIGPEMERLAKKYHLTAYVAIPNYSSEVTAYQTMIYRKVGGNFMARNDLPVGSVTVSHVSATGKCMMSHYPDTLLDRYRGNPLVKLTSKTITDWDVLNAELASIRARGYALDSEEEEDGKTCLAVPVLDSYGSIVASISLSGQTSAIFENPLNRLIGDLQEAAKLVSDRL